MVGPLVVKIDLEANAAYVTYADKAWARDERLGETVIVAFGADGEVLGIEVLGFDPATIALAARFADERQLEFPSSAFAPFGTVA